jgi:hypothetical protein
VSGALPYVLSAAGFILAVLAHLGIAGADRHARERYHELMGKYEALVDQTDSPWRGIRQEVGWWGCLKVGLVVMRGAGLLLMIGSLVFGLAS